jgi:hypothetical protein
MMEQRSYDNSPQALIIIARDAAGQVITRLSCTRSHDVVSAMKSAHSVLILKKGAVRVEIHCQEAPTSIYSGKPLAVIGVDDLLQTHNQAS